MSKDKTKSKGKDKGSDKPQPSPKTQTDAQASQAAAGGFELPRVEMHKPDWRISVAIVAVVIGIYVPVMGTYGMFDPWETHYTEVARQFMERNDWLDTH